MLRSVEQQSGERGTALVEFAVVAVVLLTLILGVIDVGRALYAYDFVSDAARRGARFAMVRGTACSGLSGGCPASVSDVQTYLQSNAPGIDTSALIVTGACVASGNSGPPPSFTLPCTAPFGVSITVHYTFGFITPLVPPNSWTMSSTAQMTVSQ